MVAANRANIRTIRESRTVRVEPGTPDGNETGLIATMDTTDFLCMQLVGDFKDEDTLIISEDQMKTLGLSAGDSARIWLRNT